MPSIILSLISLFFLMPDYVNGVQTTNQTTINITSGYKQDLKYDFNSSRILYSITLVPIDGCLVYLSVDYDNANMEIIVQDIVYYDTVYNSNYYVDIPKQKNKVDIAPRPLPIIINLKDSLNYTRNTVVTLHISTDNLTSSNPSSVQLSPGNGQMFDFAALNTTTSTVTYSVANGNSSNNYLLAFFQCDDSRVSPFKYENNQPNNAVPDYCCRIMFYQDKDYQGCLMNFASKLPSSVYSPAKPVTSLTVYAAQYSQIYSQVYFYVPQIDRRYFTQYYGVASNEVSSYLEVKSRTQFQFAVEIRFVKLEENNQKYLSHVKMNRTAQLLIYEGIAEIKGYEFPKHNLIETIKEKGKQNIKLSKPVYTFVAVGDSVYYEISDDALYSNSMRTLSYLTFIIIAISVYLSN